MCSSDLVAVVDAFGDAEGDGDEIDKQRRPNAERYGYRQFVDHQIDDFTVLEETVAEIEHQIILHHDEQPLVSRLVEAIELFKIGRASCRERV